MNTDTPPSLTNDAIDERTGSPLPTCQSMFGEIPFTQHASFLCLVAFSSWIVESTFLEHALSYGAYSVSGAAPAIRHCRFPAVRRQDLLTVADLARLLMQHGSLQPCASMFPNRCA